MPTRSSSFPNGSGSLVASLAVLLILLLGLAGAFALGSAGNQPAEAAEKTAQAGISVSGTGTIEVTPDQLEFNVTARNKRDSVNEAMDKTNATVRTVRRTLKKAGIAGKDVRTTNISVQPSYEYSNGRQSVDGYIATQQLTVTVKVLKDAGRVLSATTDAAGNRISIGGVRLVVDDRDAALASARKRAVRDARTSAEQFAAAAGRELDKVVFVQQSKSKPPSGARDGRAGNLAMMAPLAAAKAMPISAGQQEVTVKVTVRWSLS